MNKEEAIINIGILAHVDAGKTTLTENLLYLGGAIRSMGDVNKGTAHTDFLDVEKSRGISVRSTAGTLHWKQTKINLIDTPGHIDFSADVSRSVRILDAAILVLSAVEGVQSHTENIWQALKSRNIPTLIFINKIDRIGADTEAVIEEINTELDINTVVIQQSIEEGTINATIKNLWDSNRLDNHILESLASVDDELLELYLANQKISFEIADNSLRKSIKNTKLIPIMMGSAKNQIGITELLQNICNYFPSATHNTSETFSALVYKIDHVEGKGRLAGLRMYGGILQNRDTVHNYTQNKQEKINQLWCYNGIKLEDCNTVYAGDIVTVSGLSEAKVGDILGDNSPIPQSAELFSPLLTLQVRANNDSDYPKLAEALQILSIEDPALGFEWLREDKELHVKIMGWIQIEILEQVLEQRFGVFATFDLPTVIFKETPAKKAEGYIRYWMPKPCWAIIKLLIEPGASGSGVHYQSKVSTDKIHRKYQNEIERTIDKALNQGPKGWEVCDINITLIDGEDHEVHSHPGDFVVATPMAIMNGLVNSNTKFLEPYHHFKIKAPQELLGAITGDIIQLRGSFTSPEMHQEKFTLEGEFPVATSLDFPVKLSSRSGGKAKITTSFAGYRECPDEFGVIRPFKGISPLDESKYILKARKALQESFK